MKLLKKGGRGEKRAVAALTDILEGKKGAESNRYIYIQIRENYR